MHDKETLVVSLMMRKHLQLENRLSFFRQDFVNYSHYSYYINHPNYSNYSELLGGQAWTAELQSVFPLPVRSLLNQC